MKSNQQEMLLGQRIRTVLYYLNDDYVGGNTYFNKINVTVIPEQGDILIFDNADANNQPDLLTQHEGQELISGEKWLLSIWYRENNGG